MAVAAFKILDDLRQTLDDGIVLEGLEIAAAEAARVMEPVRIAAVAALNTTREELAVALQVEVTAKAAEETPSVRGARLPVLQCRPAPGCSRAAIKL